MKKLLQIDQALIICVIGNGPGAWIPVPKDVCSDLLTQIWWESPNQRVLELNPLLTTPMAIREARHLLIIHCCGILACISVVSMARRRISVWNCAVKCDEVAQFVG